MSKKYSLSVFIFRRDLRLQDNIGLIEALTQSDEVIPLFIVDPRQVGGKNKYRDDHSVQFMVESLQDLNEQLREYDAHLFVMEGEADKVIAKLIKQENVDAVFFNADYTPFSQQRDKSIQQACQKQNAMCRVYHDVTLHAPGEVLKDNGEPYTVYTPFYKRAKMHEVAPIRKNNAKHYSRRQIKGSDLSLLKKITFDHTDDLAMCGGRAVALNVLSQLSQFKNYKETRDFPAQDATTKLSAHHKFGTVSPREVYWKAIKVLGPDHQFIRELYWREFFTHVSYYFPHVYGNAFYRQYNAIAWEDNQGYFEAWCAGRTGFPIVDAGMRELNSTGYMHNRVRMIVASFLTKDLHVDWQRGERYFAQQLIDYDPAVNNGNWQWAASTGCDAVPYFRIFNPWLQQKKFDADCVYIKKWIPELRELEASVIHQWHEEPSLFADTDYPKPIVDHHIQKEKALALYKSARQ